MKALSLYQPWATLMAIGAKTIETRGNKTIFRGRLVIHAAKRFTEEQRALCATEPFCSVLAAAGYLAPTDLPLGMLLAVVELYDVIPTAQRLIGQPREWPPEPERSFGLYTEGRYAWLTRGRRVLKQPVKYRGAQGLFNVPDEVIR